MKKKEENIVTIFNGLFSLCFNFWSTPFAFRSVINFFKNCRLDVFHLDVKSDWVSASELFLTDRTVFDGLHFGRVKLGLVGGHLVQATKRLAAVFTNEWQLS